MKNPMRWLAGAALTLALLSACSSPTTPPFPEADPEDEDPTDPGAGEQPTFLELHFPDQPIYA